MQAGFCATMFKFARAILIRACTLRRSRKRFKFILLAREALDLDKTSLNLEQDDV